MSDKVMQELLDSVERERRYIQSAIGERDSLLEKLRLMYERINAGQESVAAYERAIKAVDGHQP